MKSFTSWLFKAIPWAKQVISNTLYSTNPVKPIRRARHGTKAGRHVIRPIRVIVSDNRTSASTLHHFGHSPRNLVQLTSYNTRSVPDSDRFSGKLINIIPSLIRQRTSNSFHQQSANHQNLAKIPKAIPEDKLIILFTLNCRSVKNKTLAVADFIQSHNADLLAITETWLGSGIDKSAISDITPQGYGIHHVSRHGRKEGSVALVYNSNIEVTYIRNEDKLSNFELLECSVAHRNVKFRIVVIYRLPPSKNNNFRVSHFSEEFSSFVQKAADSPDELIITGDFNFHLDDPNDSNSRTFLEILDEHCLS